MTVALLRNVQVEKTVHMIIIKLNFFKIISIQSKSISKNLLSLVFDYCFTDIFWGQLRLHLGISREVHNHGI